MASINECLDTVIEATDGAITREDAQRILERVDARRAALDAQGRIARADEQLRQLVAEDAERTRIEAAIARKHAALNAIVRDRLETAIIGHVRAGLSPRAAVLAVLEGTTRNVQGARRSVAAHILAFEARYHGRFMAQMVRKRPQMERLLGNERINDDAIRLMRGEDVPGASQNARWLAETFAEHAELIRRDLNSLGANIGKLEGWVPQAHSDWRLLRATKEEWIDYIRPRLDLERTFADALPEDVNRILGDIYDNITLGRETEGTPARRGEFRAPHNFANALNRHRVLHFANADAWIEYNKRFGHGDLFSSMMEHMRHSARMAGMMQVMGPNPGIMLDSLLGALVDRVRADTTLSPKARGSAINALRAGISAPEGGRGGTIGSAYAVVSGFANARANWTLAQAGSSIRAMQSMAKLGGAVITAITDLSTLALNLNYQGMPLFTAYSRIFRQLLHGRGRGQQRELAFLLGEGFDGITSHFVARYGVLDTVPGLMSDLMTKFFRITGLSGWTDMSRAIGSRIMAADMGQRAANSFDALPASYRRVLQQHGISPDDWDAIRRTAWTGENGVRYVTPDQIEDRDLSLAVQRFYADESVFGVIEVDESTRRFSSFGTRPGTVGGEVIRMVMQFKGFPIAFTARVLGRAFRGTSGWDRVYHIGKMLAVLTVSGYLSQVGKDIARGRTPKDPSNPATIAQALLQSGAAGLYGDFLFNMGGNRFGNSALETLAGPAVSTTADLINIYQGAIAGEFSAAQAFNTALGMVPGQNIWFLRPAMDYLFLNALRESISPGYRRRLDRRLRDDFGQEQLFFAA